MDYQHNHSSNVACCQKPKDVQLEDQREQIQQDAETGHLDFLIS